MAPPASRPDLSCCRCGSPPAALVLPQQLLGWRPHPPPPPCCGAWPRILFTIAAAAGSPAGSPVGLGLGPLGHLLPHFRSSSPCSVSTCLAGTGLCGAHLLNPVGQDPLPSQCPAPGLGPRCRFPGQVVATLNWPLTLNGGAVEMVVSVP